MRLGRISRFWKLVMSSLTVNKTIYIARARALGATYVLDVCDGFDYSHYPVFVMPGDNLQRITEEHSQNMQCVYGTYAVGPEESIPPEIRDSVEALKDRDSAIETLYNVADLKIQGKIGLDMYDKYIQKGNTSKEALQLAVADVRLMLDEDA